MIQSKRRWLHSCSAALISISTFAGAQSRVDLIAIHGKVWTENPQKPEAEAFAVRGHHIVAIGNSDDILKLRDDGTKIIDLEERRVVPGFNDAHVHFFWG